VDNGTILYSNLPKLNPWLVAVLDITSLGYLVFYMWYKTTWRKITSNSKVRLWLLIAIFIICVFDCLLSAIRDNFPYLTNFFRPLVMLLYLAQQRAQMKNIFLFVLKDTAIIILMIYAYVIFYSLIGFYLFKYTLEGFAVFSTQGSTIYQMLICLTTANFPDVMLPAYNSSRYNCLFFIVYLLIGLYCLNNILLAVVFGNYKQRL
jgi:two pore calcium channel protein, plant